MPIDALLRDMAFLREAIALEEGSVVIYDDGGGSWETVCIDSEPRRFLADGEPDPLWPGGTTLRCRAREGTTFSWHKHFALEGEGASWEVFVIKGGILEVTCEFAEPLVLSASMVYAVEPGRRHSIRAITEVLFICTTIPTAGGFSTHGACPDGFTAESGMARQD